MKALLTTLYLLAIASSGRAADDFLDRVDQALTLSTSDGNVRARLSGTLELEAYHFSQPAPGLIDSTSDSLFNPRLTLFLDGQLGSRIYLFAQARADRGFDPSNGGSEVRLDEYAMRVTPWEDGRLSLQIGKFATVVGGWNARHLAWDNPFINAPFPYENVTAVSDLEPPLSAPEFARTRIDAHSKYEHTPIVWGSSYATGVSLGGRIA
ncbi:MAG: hypothetical protein QOF24_1820, partial [Verrucomicrobiota bacterium]